MSAPICQRTEVVAFDKRAGIEEVQHKALSFVPHLGDIVSQAALNFRQPLVHILQWNGTFRQPAFRDVGIPARDGQSPLLQVLNRHLPISDVAHDSPPT